MPLLFTIYLLSLVNQIPLVILILLRNSFDGELNIVIHLKMKSQRVLHIILAGGGCVALLIYVLACTYGRTSFSPNDQQVLYPSVDSRGAMSIALYDRATGRSEQIQLADSLPPITNSPMSCLHAEWLPDGRHIILAQMKEKVGLAFSVLLPNEKKTVRQIILSGFDDEVAASMIYPFAMLENQVFIDLGKRFARINWATGQMIIVTNEPPVFILHGGTGKAIHGIRAIDQTPPLIEYGTIDPQTLKFISSYKVKGRTNQNEVGMPLFEPKTREEYYFSTEKTYNQFNVLKNGKEKLTRKILRDKDEVTIAGEWLELSPEKNCVLTAYLSQSPGQTNFEYGLLEIPLNQSPLRFTPLFYIKDSSRSEFLKNTYLMQPSLSHDGRTWAVSSAWLTVGENDFVLPEDVALYLVQIDGPKPKITKVPIKLPSGRSLGKH